MKKKQQKGSLLIEMMAIIGLLTLITPVMFQQVHRRNEEIVNAQIATEMRMIKDSVASYLEARGEKIARTPCTSSSTDCCGNSADEALWRTTDGTDGKYRNTGEGMVSCELNISEIDKFLVGSDTASSVLPHSLLDEYQISAFGYTVETGCDASGSCSYRPALFAVIAEAPTSYTPQLRRKAKIAALIGSEGGVIDFGSGKIQGMQGSWSMPLDYTEFDGASGQYAVAAVTFFNNISASSILKDVRWQHVKATTVQADTIVGEQIAANALFSVGTDTASGSDNCIQSQGTNDVQIVPSGSGANDCKAFFEVNSETKEVRISGARLRSGVATTTYYCEDLKERECSAAGCSWNDASGCSGGQKTASCGGKLKTVCDALPGCSYYPVNNTCLSCSDYNNLASPNNSLQRRKFWCERGGCAWVTPESGTAYCDKEYLLDPSRKSVANKMAVTNDITIASRGNRSVAGSLPNEVYMGNTVSCFYDSSVPGVRCLAEQEEGKPSPLGVQCINDAGDLRGKNITYQTPAFCNAMVAANANNDDPIVHGGHRCSFFGEADCPSPCIVVTEAAQKKCRAPARIACLKYCEGLKVPCENAVGNTLAPRCAAVTAECSRRCSMEYSTGAEMSVNAENMVFKPFYGNGNNGYYAGQLLMQLRQVCYIAMGHCRLVWDNKACPDTSFSPTVKHQITNLTITMDANPGGTINSPANSPETIITYDLYGTSGINFDEYCVAPK